MKNLIKSRQLALVLLMGFALGTTAQETLQNYRPDGKVGLNIFESPKDVETTFDELYVKIGGDFALQYQSIDNSNDARNLNKLGSNLNLPTANLNLDVQLEDGLRMHLRTYLSARHHEESWVKGGYFQMDKLDFVKPGFLSGFMEIATIRVGMDEFNYGDAHFRRTDNARAISNPFVGNYIMDSFSTEAFGELTIQKSDFIGVVGITNGKLNQNVTITDASDNKLSVFGKLGFDKQVNDDLRLRLTGSWYINKGETTGTYLFGGDRAGSRYYNVMHLRDDVSGRANSDFTGRINPRFKQLTAIQINPFVKFNGLEFFGIYEVANGDADGEGSMTQIAGEVLYRFGKADQLYLGTRYNTVTGNAVDGEPDQEINRFNIGGGWFMTNNVLAKLEYVSQTYDNVGTTNPQFSGGVFNGIVFEAAISF